MNYFINQENAVPNISIDVDYLCHLTFMTFQIPCSNVIFTLFGMRMHICSVEETLREQPRDLFLCTRLSIARPIVPHFGGTIIGMSL